LAYRYRVESLSSTLSSLMAIYFYEESSNPKYIYEMCPKPMRVEVAYFLLKVSYNFFINYNTIQTYTKTNRSINSINQLYTSKNIKKLKETLLFLFIYIGLNWQLSSNICRNELLEDTFIY